MGQAWSPTVDGQRNYMYCAFYFWRKHTYNGAYFIIGCDELWSSAIHLDRVYKLLRAGGQLSLLPQRAFSLVQLTGPGRWYVFIAGPVVL